MSDPARTQLLPPASEPGSTLLLQAIDPIGVKPPPQARELRNLLDQLKAALKETGSWPDDFEEGPSRYMVMPVEIYGKVIREVSLGAYERGKCNAGRVADVWSLLTTPDWEERPEIIHEWEWNDRNLQRHMAAARYHLRRARRVNQAAPPPILAQYLLCFLPRQQRANLLGDLEEEFRQHTEKFGPRWARLWYWGQVIISFWPLFTALCKAIATGTFAAWVHEVIQRIIR